MLGMGAPHGDCRLLDPSGPPGPPARQPRQLRERPLERCERTSAGSPSFAAPATLRSATRRTGDRKSTRLNSSHTVISYAVFCLKKKKQKYIHTKNATRLIEQ